MEKNKIKKLLLVLLSLPFMALGQVFTHKLDSIIEYGTSGSMQIKEQKIEYVYDINNNLISKIKSDWGTNAWNLKTKYSYTYDVNNNLILQINSHWGNSAWNLETKYEYTYDTNNNETTQIKSNYSSSNSWTLSYRYEYTYDANNNLTAEIYSTWDQVSNSWDFYNMYEYTYDSNNNLTLYMLTEPWGPVFMESYSYDANNNMTLKVLSWNTSSGFQLDHKYEYTYDANNNQTTRVYYSFPPTGSSFEEENKYEYTYDINNNQMSVIYSEWGANSWDLKTKYEYTYDTNNNFTERSKFDWNPTSLSWDFSNIFYGGYNLSGLYSQGLGINLYNPPISTNIPIGFNINLHDNSSGLLDSVSLHFSPHSTTYIDEENPTILYMREVIKVIDLLGRETNNTNQPLLYLYDDGTVEKRIVIE